MTKWLSPSRLGLIGGLILILLIPLLWTRSPAPVVRLAQARQETLVIRVSTNGTVEPIEDREVRARLSARVVEIPDPGTAVQKGQVIVQLDAGPVAADIEAARSERLSAFDALRAARATLDLARQRFATDDDLHAKGGLTTDQWRESRGALEEAEAKAEFLEKDVPLRVASLDLRMRDLEEQRAGAVVTATLDGTIYRTEVRKGEMVRVGDLILRYADLSRLRVRTNIDQVDLGKVRDDQTARILSNAYPGREWKGSISEIIPDVRMKENRAVAEALTEVTSGVEGLVPGMTVDVELVVQEVPNALQVPADAVFDEGQGPFVYKFLRGKVRKTAIRTGLSSLRAVEVTAGLEPGDTVVLGPVPGIYNGMRVDVHEGNGERS
jgi:RND family efflux transporter MFP subunit